MKPKLHDVVGYDPDTGIMTRLSTGKECGTLRADGYRRVAINNKKYYVHRLAFLYMTGRLPETIDHIDGNPSNNAWCNLREVTTQQNMWNRSSKGYKLEKRTGRYEAYINIDGTYLSLGTFDTESEARAARVAGELKYYKEHARGKLTTTN